ncbi:hypothetical protein A1F97_08175 [Pyrenophora tritici-repentis]|nr:hypothetical protein A1F97_08175 [Pyrenophora tritici-repentis]
MRFISAIPFILSLATADWYDECDCHSPDSTGTWGYNWELTFFTCVEGRGRYIKETGRCRSGRPNGFIGGEEWTNFSELPRVGFGRAVAIGIGAGFMGALVMTGTNKLEQLFIQRPSSYVPARTIGNHFSVSPDFYAKHSDLLNHLHHFGMGMLAGPVRSIMSFYGC